MTIYCTCLFSGGLGNQLFQIAIAYCISKEMNYQLCFQKGQFRGCGQGNHPSKYYNSIYNKQNIIFKNINCYIMIIITIYIFSYHKFVFDNVQYFLFQLS